MLQNTIPAGSKKKPLGWHEAVRGSLARNKWLMADQALVSGMNFATTVLLARLLGVHDFGIFSVLYFCLTYLNVSQIAVFVNPMMTVAPQMREPAQFRAFLRGMAGFQYLGSATAAALAALLGLLDLLHIVPYAVGGEVVIPFVLTVLFFQVQDWFRRYCFVQDLARDAFQNDVISYVGQLVALMLLWWARRMTIGAAYYAIAATSLLAFGWGFANHDLTASWTEIKAAAARAWQLGRSLLVVAQVQCIGSHGIFLLIAAIAGANAASGIRAAITLLGPVNVVYMSLENVIPVRASRAYAEGGERKLVAYLMRTGTVLGMLVGVPILLVSVFCRSAMTLVFGHAYAGFASLVAWEGAYMLLTLVYRGLVYYHRTMNTAAVLARAAIFVAVVEIIACVFLTRRFGATGGMAALVFGQLLNVAVPLYSALGLHRRAGDA